MRSIHLLALAATLLLSMLVADVRAADGPSPQFVTVRDGQFYCQGKPYYFIGTNYWYGPLLASPGPTGDRQRLAAELDFLAAHGMKNLRILAGAEGPDGEPSRVTPGLQQSPGVYNEDLLAGLDYLLAEMAKRDMKAVLYLNNTWEWSGGYAQYLNWNGRGEIPYPNVKSWPEFMNYAGGFHDCRECIEDYFNHVRFMLGRTNQVTGVKYVDDPTIMSWQIANEPRALSREHIPAFEKWVKEAAALLGSLDANHLVSTGNEGTAGSEYSMDLYRRLHADPNVDYCTIHIWPKNWGWLAVDDIPGSLDRCIERTNQYLEEHCAVARELGKPITLEEYGFPRDGHAYTLDSTTASRDAYYDNVFAAVVRHRDAGDVLAGPRRETPSGARAKTCSATRRRKSRASTRCSTSTRRSV